MAHEPVPVLGALHAVFHVCHFLQYAISLLEVTSTNFILLYSYMMRLRHILYLYVLSGTMPG